MDLRQLRYFVTVADTLHFGRAAERLGMTQPPLSQAIIALEQELGVRLFARTRRVVTLTPAGSGLLPHAVAVLDSANRLPEIARGLARGEQGALVLAFVSIAALSLLPELVRMLTARFPGIDLQLREATSDVQLELLREGRIDAGLSLPPPEARSLAGLTYRALTRERLMLALPDEWLDAGRVFPDDGESWIAELHNMPQIVFPREVAPAFHDAIAACLANHGIAPRLAQAAIQMQTIVSLVSAGMGFAIVPQSMQNLPRTGVRYLPLPNPAPEIELGLVWRNQNVSPPLARFLALVWDELNIDPLDERYD